MRRILPIITLFIPLFTNYTFAQNCTDRITNLYFNRLDGGADIAITNGANYDVSQIAGFYNLEASTNDTIESMVYTISGPTASTNTDNIFPYNAPFSDTAWNPVAGSYTINAKVYSTSGGSGGGGSVCHDTTITFNLVSLLEPASIGDYVWFDANGNGRQNSTELGVPGVGVKLTNVNTNEMFTTTTNSNGKYLFTGLAPGTYKVQFTPPAGPNGNSYGITRSNFGTDGLDNDIGPTWETGNYTLIAGQVDTSVDAGITLPDLQLTLTFSPTTFVVYDYNNFTLPINVVCRVSEVNRAATNGSNIVIKIPRIIFIDFTYQPSLTSVEGQPVDNNQWTLSQDAIHWIFTYSGILPAFANSYFGFTGTFNTHTASGVYFMVAEIVNGSGGEWNYNNNSDSERVDYFSN